MKIAHEAPISIFDQIRQRTDYDYCLVHLMDENEKYRKHFFESKQQGREILLDNSIFELGTAYDASKFATWVERLEPDWYIVPDVLCDGAATIKQFKEFKYELPGKKIAVAQGRSVNEFIECYRELAPLADKIAMSFDYPFFINEDIYGKLPTKFHYYMLGRDALLHFMMLRGILHEDKPHHLLGCGLPQEFASYSTYKWIDSVDTSNPVVAGIKGMAYNGVKGLEDKPTQKLFELINYAPTNEQMHDILYNVDHFRKIACGLR